MARATKAAKATKKRGGKQARKKAPPRAAPARPVGKKATAAPKSPQRAVAKKAAAPAKTAGAAAKRADKAGRSSPAKAPSKAPSKAPAKSAARAPARAARGRARVGDKFLLEQRSALEAERETYLAQAETLKAEADQMAQEAEPGDVQFDEESGEGGTMNIDRERDLALSAQARAAVEDIDLALAKIAGGTYGFCERCGQPIPKARLKALPQARLCVGCKSGGLSRR